jgi:hypothetical protein
MINNVHILFVAIMVCSIVFTINVRGVLGNKCAGQQNLKTVNFGETFASFFGMVISNMCVFLQRSIYPSMAAAGFYVTMVGATPLQALLEGALVQQAACQL